MEKRISELGWEKQAREVWLQPYMTLVEQGTDQIAAAKLARRSVKQYAEACKEIRDALSTEEPK